MGCGCSSKNTTEKRLEEWLQRRHRDGNSAHPHTPGSLLKNQRKDIFIAAKAMGGKEGAEHLHWTLPALYWGVSRTQLREFVDEVRKAVNEGRIQNETPSHLPQYPLERFNRIGPNMHQVNAQFIKLVTNENAPIAFASYALQKNSESGLRCDLFISHAWDEGAYEFGRNALNGWNTQLEGAYICFLANPQNLDISELVKTPTQSPFYKVLESEPYQMLMLVNENTPIHSRLWCVYEAHCAAKIGTHNGVYVTGNPTFLVPDASRSELETAMTQFAMQATPEELSGHRSFYQELKLVLATSKEKDGMKRRLGRAFNSIELDVRDARCSNESDKQKIWTEVGREESALDTLNDGIKSILWGSVIQEVEVLNDMTKLLDALHVRRGFVGKLRSFFAGAKPDSAEVRRRVNRIFQVFDISNSGAVTMSQMQQVFERFDRKMPEIPQQEIEKYFKNNSDEPLLTEDQFYFWLLQS